MGYNGKNRKIKADDTGCIRYPEFDYKSQAVEHFEIMLAGLYI